MGNTQEHSLKQLLLNFDQPFFCGQNEEGNIEYGLSGDGIPSQQNMVKVPAMGHGHFGDRNFLAAYGVKKAYMSGAMANGIASADLVIAMGKQGFLSSFGAAGLVPSEIEKAINRIQTELPNGPYAFNLIHSPSEVALEKNAVELYLRYKIKTIEASAYIEPSQFLVWYRVAGLSKGTNGEIIIGNKIIAKISRREVATRFLQPPNPAILNNLLAEGKINKEQFELAANITMADDITVEADSGGHTDNRSLVCLLPSIIALRNEIGEKFPAAQNVRIGAAGGIGTPDSAFASFALGAAYIVTGSINQSCLESGSSTQVRKLLAEADVADIAMAPAADMFEMGVKLQVLKRGTMFSGRAQKLYEFYRTCNSLEEIPLPEREKLEKQVFKKTLAEVWQETKKFFTARDPQQLHEADNNPKKKMALVFRWYLGLSSRWANIGEAGRELDYQVWCGPAMGAFNEWTKNSILEKPEGRQITVVAQEIMNGVSYLARVHFLRSCGIIVPASISRYQPFDKGN